MPMTVSNGLRHIAAHMSPDVAGDGELLARFLNHRDEVAFAVLVRRHAAMVLGTCRRVLGNATDADDAFQAAFVVLVRKAHSLTDSACVGGYLYGIAFRTALKAKATAAKRRKREGETPVKPPEPPADQSELLTALDEELSKLPAKYRELVVLCELEGRSRREASGLLGIPEGTISSRLAKAHRMLEKRLRSRGFAGVVLAVFLAGQQVTAGDALAQVAVRAVISPPPAVTQLASEVTKMMLLHKLGIGAAAFAVVLALTAVTVGAMLPTPPAEEPPRAAKAAGPNLALPTAAPVPAAKEPEWKTEFRKAYGLKEGELIRRVAPPYPPCRVEYFKDLIREFYKRQKKDPPEAEVNQDYSNHFTKFGWKNNWSDPHLLSHVVPIKPEDGVQLQRVLEVTTGFRATRMDAENGLLETMVTGDWVVRADADPAKLAAALETILRKECGLKLSLAIKDAEREVYVLSGKYVAKPLPDRKANEIEVYATELGDRNTGGGGGPGTLEQMADHVEGWIEVPIVLGKIENAPKVEWHFNFRSPFTAEQHAADKDPAANLANIAAQTGLTVKKEKRTIKVLVVKKD